MALLEIGGRTLYGMNAQGAGMPRRFREFFSELAPEVAGKGFALGSTGHLSHAEADALIQAYDRGLTREHKAARMYVDREVCSRYCMNRGGLPRLLLLVGIDQLHVYDPTRLDGVLVTPLTV